LGTRLNLEYCNNYCQKGIEMRNKFLDKNNSAYDAAMDFRWFVEKCFETCIYKDKHLEEANLNG
jgi:hypothetical protein